MCLCMFIDKPASFYACFYLFVYVLYVSLVCLGSRMCLCDCPDGSVLVHRGAATGCDCSAASAPFPSVWNYEVKRCKCSETSQFT